MATKREFEVELRYMQNPPRMSLKEALAAERPEYEISIRIAAKGDELSPAEKLFYEADCFLGDTLNGGLIQTLGNDTGSLTNSIHDFATKYCDESVAQVISDLKAMFSGGVVPVEREERNRVIEQMTIELAFDPFDALTKKFYALESNFIQGLLKLATDCSNEFTSLQ